MSERYALGIDSSTTSTTYVVLSGNEILFRDSIPFDEIQNNIHSNGCGLKGGFLTIDDSTGEHFANPLAIALGIDRSLGGIPYDLVPHIKEIGVTAQQHGATFLKQSMEQFVPGFDPAKSIARNLMGLDVFTRVHTLEHLGVPLATMWKNANTQDALDRLLNAGLGESIFGLTGNPAHHRFTGLHVSRFAKEEPEAYARTNQIVLLSSYVEGLLTGKPQLTEALGTLTENIHTRQLDTALLTALMPGYSNKPDNFWPALVSPRAQANPTTRYIEQRYGLLAAVAAPLGDNIASMIGVGAIEEGIAAMSMGSSDTLYIHKGQKELDVETNDFCVFGAATGNKDLMAMLVYNNGAHTREEIARDAFHIRQDESIDWDEISTYLLNEVPRVESMGVYFTQNEIVPHTVEPKVERRNLSRNDRYNFMALIEARAMSMRYRLEQIGAMPSKLYLTGGAANNRGIAQVVANVMNIDVCILETSDSAAVGAALHARSVSTNRNLADVVAPFTRVKETFSPESDKVAVYNRKLSKYIAFENQVVSGS